MASISDGAEPATAAIVLAPTLDINDMDVSVAMDLPLPLKRKLVSMAEQLRSLHTHVTHVDKENDKRFARCVNKIDCAAALNKKADKPEIDDVEKRMLDHVEQVRISIMAELGGQMTTMIHDAMLRVESNCARLLSEADAKHAAAEEKLRQEAAEQSERTRELEEYTRALQRELEAANLQLSRFDTRFTQLVGSIAECNQSIASLDKLIQRNTIQLSAVEARIRDVYDGLNAQISMLRSQLASLTDQQRTMTEQQHTALETIHKQAEQVAVQQKQQQQEQVAKAKKKQAQKEEEYAKTGGPIPVAAQQEMLKQTETLTQDLSGIKRQLVEIQQEAGSMRAMLKQSMSDNRNANEKLVAQLASLRTKHDAFKSDSETQHAHAREALLDLENSFGLRLNDVEIDVHDVRDRLDAMLTQDQLLAMMRKQCNEELVSVVTNDFSVLGLLMPVKEGTMDHLRKLGNWLDMQQAVWTRIGKGEDFIGVSNESAGHQRFYSGSFEPLNTVHNTKKCLSCNQSLEPYLVMTPRPHPRLPDLVPSATVSGGSAAPVVLPAHPVTSELLPSEYVLERRRSSVATRAVTAPSSPRRGSVFADPRRTGQVTMLPAAVQPLSASASDSRIHTSSAMPLIPRPPIAKSARYPPQLSARGSSTRASVI
eukprot:TRINITY_DN5117_c0_g1_i1.p1 TRINITY_DN5117_c0_g1~~TRINITY_DN5117_c0_g1_i1.p1  ORF type:complete len:653 (+),score=152.53 TRINITY_DN5117_c0_g1_i1:101-2059(+)